MAQRLNTTGLHSDDYDVSDSSRIVQSTISILANMTLLAIDTVQEIPERDYYSKPMLTSQRSSNTSLISETALINDKRLNKK
jgi:hypothetical protein